MKNANQKQIEQIKKITAFDNTSFHGNTRKIGSLSITEYKDIVSKRYTRLQMKNAHNAETNVQLIKNLISWSRECMGTSYFKTIIEGNTGYYYASPLYGHLDYNKTRLFDITEETTKLVNIFKKLVK